jgi:glycogen debranching enzyme
VDSTPLFLLLFAETLKWTGDRAFFRELWPNAQRALEWAWRYGDIDGDGFIEYTRRSPRGIRHQGWKDSDESMGGTLGPRPSMPLALMEVQGYYYAALVELAWALRSYGDAGQQALAERLEKQAIELKEKFNRDFWYDEIGFYAQALDAGKKPVLSVTSNLGHCLWSGIVDDDKARKVVDRLISADMLSGWGVRTLSASEPIYNPMSYHNGSVWPHDNALLVAGLRRYGFHDEMLEVAGQIFSAAATFPQYRLPELYCGFPRGMGAEREGAPAAYPVSCSPQAWAAGTPMLLLQALLGLQVDAGAREVTLSPVLPAGVDSVAVKGLTVGGKRIDLSVACDTSGQVGLRFADSSQEAASDIQVRLRPATAGAQPAQELGIS